VPRTLDALDAGNWAALLDVLEVAGMARSMAAHALPERVGANSLRLLLQEEHATLHSAPAEERLAGALARHFGAELKLEIVHGHPVGETPAARDLRRAAERQRAAAEAIAADANVRLLVETFGGQLHAETISAAGTAKDRDAARQREEA
jgi:hypothetical protein